MTQGSLEFLSGSDFISKENFQWNYIWKFGHSEKLYFEIFAVWPTIFLRKKQGHDDKKEAWNSSAVQNFISKISFQWNYSWKLGHSEKFYFEIFAVQPTIFHRKKTRSWWQKRSLEFFSSPDLYFQNSFLSVLYIEKEKENSSEITKKQWYKAMKIKKIWLFM